MPYIVYEATNLVNGKKYRGAHKQDGDEFDGYLGSGKALKRAIAKYGPENFERRTMFSFDDEAACLLKESEVVDEEWCKRKDTYNMKVGGLGGFPWVDPEFRKRKSEQMKALHADPDFKKRNAERAGAKMEALHADPEFKKRNSERSRAKMEALNADPEFKKRNSERTKARHADPEFRKRLYGGLSDYYASRRLKKANSLLAVISCSPPAEMKA